MKAITSCILDLIGVPFFIIGCLFMRCGKLAWAKSDKMRGRKSMFR